MSLASERLRQGLVKYLDLLFPLDISPDFIDRVCDRAELLPDHASGMLEAWTEEVLGAIREYSEFKRWFSKRSWESMPAYKSLNLREYRTRERHENAIKRMFTKDMPGILHDPD